MSQFIPPCQSCAICTGYLHSSTSASRSLVESLVVQSLSGKALVCLTNDCCLTLPGGRLWWSPAAFCQHSWCARGRGPSDPKPFPQQKFLCRQPSPVECPPINIRQSDPSFHCFKRLVCLVCVIRLWHIVTYCFFLHFTNSLCVVIHIVWHKLKTNVIHRRLLCMYLLQSSRWALLCCLCRERVGACIQCCVKACKTSFHVTCAFQYGLDLKTTFDEDCVDVQLKVLFWINFVITCYDLYYSVVTIAFLL